MLRFKSIPICFLIYFLVACSSPSKPFQAIPPAKAMTAFYIYRPSNAEDGFSPTIVQVYGAGEKELRKCDYVRFEVSPDKRNSISLKYKAPYPEEGPVYGTDLFPEPDKIYYIRYSIQPEKPVDPLMATALNLPPPNNTASQKFKFQEVPHETAIQELSNLCKEPR